MIEYKPYIHQAKELEDAVLGVSLLEKYGFGRTYGIIDEDCFYNSANKKVYICLKEMFQSNIPIDLLSATDFILNKKRETHLDNVNVPYYLCRLTNNVVSGANVEYHSHLLKEMWKRRKILEVKYKSIENDLDPNKNIFDLNTELNKILGNDISKDWYDMSEMMINLYKHQDEVKKRGGIGLLTGFNTLDKENGGFFEGQFIIIGARPSVGKSAFAGTIAMSIASMNKTVGIVSLEMSNVEVAGRLAAIDTNTDYAVLFRGLYIDEKETNALYTRIANHTSTLPIYVSDKTDVNVMEIKAKAQKLKATHGLDCLIIDYLQLVNSPDLKNRNREQEISNISRSAKIMAQEMNIPVIVLCQLNREITKRKGNERYPQLSDLRESGSLEQDADIVMFLHSDYMAGFLENEDGSSTEGQADLVIRKWRNGKNNFVVPLTFDGPKMRFMERGGNYTSSPAGSYYEVQNNNNDDNPF